MRDGPGSRRPMMPAICEFTVPGVPIAQPRQRHRVVCGHVSNYTPTNSPVNAWKAAVMLAAAAAYNGPPLEGPLEVEMLFVFPRPVSKTRKRGPNLREPKATAPDCDNIAKACLDCLHSVLFRNDAQVWSLLVRKFIASADESPHMVMSITEYDDASQAKS